GFPAVVGGFVRVRGRRGCWTAAYLLERELRLLLCGAPVSVVFSGCGFRREIVVVVVWWRRRMRCRFQRGEENRGCRLVAVCGGFYGGVRPEAREFGVRDVAAAKGDGRSSGGGGRLGGKIEREMQLWCDGYLVTAGEEDEREREKRKGKGAAAGSFPAMVWPAGEEKRWRGSGGWRL
ncbi:hypothetical protein HAX54_035140, partial [Datura stramonium]|nr:hypothetical protein [Datura stramonium]